MDMGKLSAKICVPSNTPTAVYRGIVQSHGFFPPLFFFFFKPPREDWI